MVTPVEILNISVEQEDTLNVMVTPNEILNTSTEQENIQ
jgi:hypothetical protein